ncbi:MAG: cobyrinic acid a,c-diamide synthase [Desulfobacteraceae bacterium 4572_123]|nr:MAG: cobyrinic acid a,c-diamide synthase [Desulfobacteraceae bacterium 4572_123]
MKAFVIAGTHSGCGKTTLALAFMAALAARGLRVAPFKVGPDFIDPGHHTRITGRSSRNLDGWMLSKAYNQSCFETNTRQADVAVVEGVMGLYDGYDGRSEAGSTAQMAKWLGLPVVLVVDAAGMARSAAAIVHGFESFDPDLSFAGVIFNNLGSPGHFQYLKKAVQDRVRISCIGGVLRDAAVTIPERHLGLVTGDEYIISPKEAGRLAALVEQNLNLDAFLKRLPAIEPKIFGQGRQKRFSRKKVRIAIARDKAFCFYYSDNLELLAACGAELFYFSPLEDQGLPEDLDGIYLGGGYPELFAEKLSENRPMRRQILQLSQNGMPIYGECGGFMYLCEKIRDTQNRVWPMTGCFPFTTRMFTRLKALGYREVVISHDTIIGNAGLCIRGHEFHYSGIDEAPGKYPVKNVYRISARSGLKKTPEGYQVNRTLGSYNHLHFGSRPEVAVNFIQHCVKYNQERAKH